MNLHMGNQTFLDVNIPLLWGKRAVLEDKKGRISIISLEGDAPVIEILGDKPAPGIQFEFIKDGFKIIINGQDIYSFDPINHIITGLLLKLPECDILSTGIKIGSNIFSGNIIAGSPVGIAVDELGIRLGAPLPEDIAKLEIRDT